MGVFTWTATGNFPPSAGAWAGQPLAVAPAGTFWTPKIKPPAENWNYILGQIAANLQNLQPEIVVCTSSQAVPIPSWAAWILIDGCGSGGSGGGGNGTGLGNTGATITGGGGGAGAQRAAMLFPVGAMTSIWVNVGAAKTGGAGGTPAASTPGAAGPGVDGDPSTVNPGSSFNSGTIFCNLPGGAGGPAGKPKYAAYNATPTWTPGGAGQAGTHRGGPAAVETNWGPGPAQLLNIANAAGTLSVTGGAWPASVYNDPVGPSIRASDGGASYANTNATYTGVSYPGAPATEGGPGGLPGLAGTNTGSGSSDYYGGAGGGGGGGGGFGAGAAGGKGGNGATGDAPPGTAGANAAANTGAGGGGGGAAGNGTTTSILGEGIGGPGGTSGSGQVIVMFFGSGG